MRSPFPGMDPFLESRWPEVHASLIVYSRNRINRNLPNDLQANIEENVSVYADDASSIVRPDVNISSDSTLSADSPAAVATETLTTTVAEPILIRRLPHPIRHIEITTTSGRVITAIEFISPWNKVGVRSRQQYERKQADYLDAGVNLVEIDLVRQGSHVLAAPLAAIPEPQRTPYMVCIYRNTNPDQFEIYPIKVQQSLPNIPIPLRPTDRDIVLELQPIFDDCYRDGRYHRIDYSTAAKLNFNEADSAWITSRLQQPREA